MFEWVSLECVTSWPTRRATSSRCMKLFLKNFFLTLKNYRHKTHIIYHNSAKICVKRCLKTVWNGHFVQLIDKLREKNSEPFWTVLDRVGYTVLVGLKIDPGRRDGTVKKSANNSVRFPFQISKSQRCVSVTGIRMFNVDNLQDANVVVYDYYRPSSRNVATYNPNKATKSIK